MRNLDGRRIRRHLLELAHEVARAVGEIESHFDERNHLPVVGKRGVECPERVGDSSPFLYRRVVRVAAVDDVPDERADDANALHSRYRSPSICALNVATAPTTPAESGREPGTILHASTADLNALLLTSARIGSNSWSPACVTPPAMTTVSGLNTFIRLEIPTPMKCAVSRTTSIATGSPRFDASNTVCAVIRLTSPLTISLRIESPSTFSSSVARWAMAGPEAYASRQP